MANCVQLIVATHAHHDHIGNMHKIVEKSASARYVCSTAMGCEQFLNLRELDLALDDVRESVLDELERIDLSLGVRETEYAIAGSPVLHSAGSRPEMEARVTALSPSNKEFQNAQAQFADRFPRGGESPRRFKENPNETALVLWVTVGDQHILLGSDLLEGPAPDCGWAAVVDSPHLTGNRASVFKVPHHGSNYSDHPRMWSELVTEDVVSILTPYRSGKRPRPDDEDLRRIKANSGRAFVTAPTARPKLDAATRAKIASLNAYVRGVRDPDGVPGHVRVRRTVGDSSPWSVELALPALPI
jgi:hypothetical protein